MLTAANYYNYINSNQCLTSANYIYVLFQVPGFRGKMGAVFSLGMDISMLHGGEEVRLTEDYRRTQLIYM